MFELWDNDSRNVIDSFRSAVSAEDVLVKAYREHGSELFRSLFLMHEDDGDNIQLVAEGEAMLVAIKRLAAAERDKASQTPNQGRQVG